MYLFLSSMNVESHIVINSGLCFLKYINTFSIFITIESAPLQFNISPSGMVLDVIES
jgi:hypothetical protein